MFGRLEIDSYIGLVQKIDCFDPALVHDLIGGEVEVKVKPLREFRCGTDPIAESPVCLIVSKCIGFDTCCYDVIELPDARSERSIHVEDLICREFNFVISLSHKAQ